MIRIQRLAAPAVYDAHGNRQDWDWLTQKYPGVRYVLDTEHPRRFALTAVRETVGPAAVIVRVYGATGAPSQNHVGFYWPGPEEPLSTAGALARHQPYVGAIQQTDAEGHTGFGFGGGSVIKNGKGPHWAWVLSPKAGSDALADFGWLGGTDHAGPLSMDFTLVETPPPPEPDPPADWLPYTLRLWGLELPVEIRPR